MRLRAYLARRHGTAHARLSGWSAGISRDLNFGAVAALA